MTHEYDMLLKLVHERRSVRSFSERQVDDELIDKILEAGRWAPSASNRQPWRFVVVRDRERIERMAEAVRAQAGRLVASARTDAAEGLATYLEYFHHFTGAPVLIVPTSRSPLDLIGAASNISDPAGQARARAETIASVSAAIMSMLLAVQALGLGSCWMTGPLIADAELQAILEVPDGWDIAAVLPVGYADKAPAPTTRRQMSRLRKDL